MGLSPTGPGHPQSSGPEVSHQGWDAVVFFLQTCLRVSVQALSRQANFSHEVLSLSASARMHHKGPSKHPRGSLEQGADTQPFSSEPACQVIALEGLGKWANLSHSLSRNLFICSFMWTHPGINLSTQSPVILVPTDSFTHELTASAKCHSSACPPTSFPHVVSTFGGLLQARNQGTLTRWKG